MINAKNRLKTKDLIIQEARKIFLQNGFAGTSINDIANSAGINKSLIYHHFKNKEGLWKSIKEEMISTFSRGAVDQIIFSSNSLKELLNDIVPMRFNLYSTNPDLVKLMHWQRIEKSNYDIGGVNKSKLNDITPQIKELQKKGEIRKDLNPTMVSYMIFSSSANCFLDQADFLEANKENQKIYMNMVINCLERALKP